MPALDCNSKVEVAYRELKGTICENVEKLAEVPKLSVVRLLHTMHCINETHQQGDPRVAVFEILSMASCSVYCGDCLKGQIHSEDSLQLLVGVIQC